MAANPYAALDSESVQLKQWLHAFRQRYPNVETDQTQRAEKRLKEIEETKKADKRQAKRAKKVWGTTLSVIDQYAPPGVADAMRKLAKSPSDAEALATVTNTITSLAIKDPKLAGVAKIAMPLLTQLLSDDPDEKDEG